MGPQDGPSGSKELEWADVIQNELNSWDPSRLSTRFHPRSHHRAPGVWRPLPLALAVLLVALLAATALAGGPRGLTMVIANLATGRPQPSATPSSDHAGGGVHMASPAAASAVTPGSRGAPIPSQQNASQPASSGAPAGQGQTQGGGTGVPSSVGGSQPLPPQVQLPVPEQSPPSNLPPLPTPALPRLPPVPVMPPGAATPPGGVGEHPPTPGSPINHPMPARTSVTR
jgi:hypothetical protein